MAKGTKVRVVICGGRDYRLSINDIEKLDKFHEKHSITMLVSGCCEGADEDAARWATLRKVPIDPHPVSKEEWDRLGKKAGPIRNAVMAKRADAVIAFPGGRGTRNMIQQARSKGLPVTLIGWREEAEECR